MQSYEAPKHLRSRPLALLPGASLIAMLCIGAASALSAGGIDAEGKDFRRGKVASAYETHLDEHIAHRESAIVFWGVIEYATFGNGRPGVLVGSDGWLFTDEEVAFFPEEPAELESKLALVERVQAQLAAEGTQLVVALVPSKGRIYPEQLGRGGLPDYADTRYAGFRGGLLERGINAPDLVAPLMAGKAGGAVFLRTDTHWTPRGADIVAAAISDAASFPGKQTVEYTTHPRDPVRHTGDLLSFVPLGPYQDSLGPPPDTITQREVVGGGGGLGLLDEVTIPVALVGTSYSADPLWDFRGALKLQLGADVLDAAQKGSGPIVPMLDYLDNKAFTESPPQLVVWEIPERYLPVVYDDPRLDGD